MKFQIREHDRGTFWVKSRQGDGEYLVDLTALKGNGACTCPHFRCRLEPKVKEGQTRHCKHIAAVRNHVVDLVIGELSTMNKDKGAE